MYKLFFCVLLSVILTSCNTTDKPSANNAENFDEIEFANKIDSITAVIRQNPFNTDLFIERSDMYMSQGEVREAINDLEIALKTDTTRTNIYTKLSELYILVGKSESSKDILSLCIKRFPNDVEARMKLAELYFYVQMYTESMQEITYIEMHNLQNTQSYLIKSLIFLETGLHTEAIKSLKLSIEYDNNNWQAHNLIGLLFANLNDKIAIDYFSTAMTLFPDNPEVFFNAATVNYQFKKFKEAEDIYLNLISMDSTYCLAYYNLSEIYINEVKDYAQAIEVLNNAIHCDSLDYKAFYNRGYSYEKLNNFKMAENDYRKSLEIMPNFNIAVEGLNYVIEKQINLN